MKTFDIISDIHADFYIRSSLITEDSFVAELIPKNPSSVLVVAGDLSNYNRVSELLLRAFLDHYEKVLLVFGNHDLYEMDARKRRKASGPMSRWEDLKRRFEGEDRVVFLDGDVHEHDGVRFGGTGGWYDFSYSLGRLNASVTEMEEVYANGMSDAQFIPRMERFDWNFLDEERRKLESLVDQVDVLVTHVPPSATKMAERFRYSRLSGCFFFDGADLLRRTTAKIWICGHTHERFDFEENGVNIINHALGYPFEVRGSADLIRSVTVE